MGNGRRRRATFRLFGARFFCYELKNDFINDLMRFITNELFLFMTMSICFRKLVFQLKEFLPIGKMKHRMKKVKESSFKFVNNSFNFVDFRYIVKLTPYGYPKERVNVLFLSFVSDNWRKFLFPIAAIAVIVAFLLIPRGQADNGRFVLSEQNPFHELIEEDKM